jgi:uncharacterized protein YijF (DUF1287 family)
MALSAIARAAVRAAALNLAIGPAAAPAAAPNVAIARAAERQVGVTLHYDPSYVRLKYPGGDVPPDRGVCADVIIRALRDVGVDLQREVHEDMRAHFAAYPKMWGTATPDANIDHRRVPNLMAFFQRRGKRVRGDYEAGDIVAWRLPGGLYHIGIVAPDGHLMIHNIGRGTQKEDVLNAYEIIGHYRW